MSSSLFSATDLRRLCTTAIAGAEAAAAVIRHHIGRPLEVEHKTSAGHLASQVVTAVDREAQAALLEIIEPTTREWDLAILAEECPDDGGRLEKPAFWSIDPLDGTLAFIERRSGFAVSVALVAHDGTPWLGVVIDPVNGTRYHAIRGHGAFRNGRSLTIPDQRRDAPLILQTDASFRNHRWYGPTVEGLERISERQGFSGAVVRHGGGGVMSACAILDDPNVCYFKYPRRENSGGSLWDYAATACLFNEAGAIASDIFGRPMALNRADSTFMNHRGVLYAATAELAREIRQLHRDITTLSRFTD